MKLKEQQLQCAVWMRDSVPSKRGFQFIAAGRAILVAVVLIGVWVLLVPESLAALSAQLPGSIEALPGKATAARARPKPKPTPAPASKPRPVRPPLSTLAAVPKAKPKLTPRPGLSNPLRPTLVSTSSLLPVPWPSLGTYEFDVVKVDENGSVTERRKMQAQYFTEDLSGGVRLEMVPIPGGTFQMGSSESEKGHLPSEEPLLSEVRVPSFYIGRFEMTQAQWRIVASWQKVNRDLDPDPSAFKGDDRPVECVSWADAVEFCERLSRHTGRTYRLPTEAEWEYACRAGTNTPFAFGETITPELANYGNYPGGLALRAEYGNGTTPVGYFSVANAFGLYDMHGNVWEWCLDTYHTSYRGAPMDGSAWDKDIKGSRVLRGGSWGDSDHDSRSARRGWSDIPDFRIGTHGFRVVMVDALYLRSRPRQVGARQVGGE